MKHFRAVFEFTEVGMDLFRQVLSSGEDDTEIDLSDPENVNEVLGTKEFRIRNFATAKEMASFVLNILGDARVEDLVRHDGLWGWLTFVMRDQLFNRDRHGKRIVGELHRWFPSQPNDWRKGQRHLVRMPVILLNRFGDDVDHLLCSSPAVLPEIREQLTSQQDMYIRSFQRVARRLYFDDRRNALKVGAGGKGAGSARRLAKVRLQLSVTWDLESMDESEILAMLPSEFDKFKV